MGSIMDLDFTRHNGYLEVAISGTYSMNDAITKLSMIVAGCQAMRLTRTLVDFRQMTGILLATEQVLYAFYIHAHHNRTLGAGGEPLRVAYVGSPGCLEMFRLGVQYAKGNGLPFQLFTDWMKPRDGSEPGETPGKRHRRAMLRDHISGQAERIEARDGKDIGC